MLLGIRFCQLRYPFKTDMGMKNADNARSFMGQDKQDDQPIQDKK